MHLQIFDTGTLQAYAVQGSIFEEQSVDVLALFRNRGLAALPVDIKCFLLDKGLEEKQNILLPCEGTHGDVKAVYYIDNNKSPVDRQRATTMLFDLLDTVSKAGYISIAMNGIRTDGNSEYDNVRAIREWAVAHPGSSIKTVLLVDLRGGFNKLAKAQPPR